MVDAQPDLENIRTGYRAAIDLWLAAASQNWSRFHMMILVNTIIMAVIVQVLAEKLFLPYNWTIPGFGLLVCLLWIILLARGAAYQDYYIACARELERHLIPLVVSTRGDDFARGQAVNVDETTLQMPLLGRLRNRVVLYVAVVVFAALYILSLVLLVGGILTTAIRKPTAQHFLLLDKTGISRLQVSAEGSFTLEFSDKDGKVIWKAP